MRKETLQGFFFGVGMLALIVLLSTPLCVWLASADNCKRLIMNRPVLDAFYGEAWFDLFR